MTKLLAKSQIDGHNESPQGYLTIRHNLFQVVLPLVGI
jgi:hypothetical protein